jgi:hypothetical protein
VKYKISKGKDKLQDTLLSDHKLSLDSKRHNMGYTSEQIHNISIESKKYLGVPRIKRAGHLTMTNNIQTVNENTLESVPKSVRIDRYIEYICQQYCKHGY